MYINEKSGFLNADLLIPCTYSNSRQLLQIFPSRGSAVLLLGFLKMKV